MFTKAMVANRNGVDKLDTNFGMATMNMMRHDENDNATKICCHKARKAVHSQLSLYIYDGADAAGMNMTITFLI